MRWDVDDYDSNGKLILLNRLMRVINEGHARPGQKILDVGGWGKLSKRLSQDGCKVTLLNIDKEECDRIYKRYGDSFEILTEDIRRSRIPDEEFDTVTCFETLEHIREDRDKAIAEIFRVLKPGGTFVGTIPIPGECHPVDDPTVSFITPDELRTILLGYSLKILIEPTADFNNRPCSWYFVAKKDRV